MERLRKDFEERIEAFANDRVANDDYTRSDPASATFQSFKDGIAMAARSCADAPEDLRAGMRQIEMKIDKTAAGAPWIRGVLEGFVRNPGKEPEAKTPVSEWREDGDSASP